MHKHNRCSDVLFHSTHENDPNNCCAKGKSCTYFRETAHRYQFEAWLHKIRRVWALASVSGPRKSDVHPKMYKSSKTSKTSGICGGERQMPALPSLKNVALLCTVAVFGTDPHALLDMKTHIVLSLQTLLAVGGFVKSAEMRS